MPRPRGRGIHSWKGYRIPLKPKAEGFRYVSGGWLAGPCPSFVRYASAIRPPRPSTNCRPRPSQSRPWRCDRLLSILLKLCTVYYFSVCASPLCGCTHHARKHAGATVRTRGRRNCRLTETDATGIRRRNPHASQKHSAHAAVLAAKSRTNLNAKGRRPVTGATPSERGIPG